MSRAVARTVRTLRSELEDEDPVRVSVVLVAIALLTDSRGIVLGGLLAILGLAVLRTILAVLDAPAYASGILIGGGGGVGSAVAAVVSLSWLYVALAVVGCWLCLDSLYDRRHGIDRSSSEPADPDPLADASMREAMRFTSDAGTVLEVLRDSPVALTPAQIADRTELSRENVKTILEGLEDGDVVERTDDRYTVDERQLGPSSVVCDAIRRLCRPVSVLVPGRGRGPGRGRSR